jgi:hypothetical protein
MFPLVLCAAPLALKCANLQEVDDEHLIQQPSFLGTINKRHHQPTAKKTYKKALSIYDMAIIT